jgi:hypothetical protein
VWHYVKAPLRDHLCHVVVSDFGDQLVRAEIAHQPIDQSVGIVGPGVVLPDVVPITLGDVVEPQREGARVFDFYLGSESFFRAALFCFCFAAIRKAR